MKTDVYEKTANRAADRYNDYYDNCVPIALALTTGRTYGRVYRTLEKYGRIRNNYTSLGMIMESIASLTGERTSLFTCEHLLGESVLVRQLRKHLPKGNYIALTRNHAVAITDGQIHDWQKRSQARVCYLLKVGEN